MIILSAQKYNKLRTNLYYAQLVNVELLEKLRIIEQQNEELEKESKKLYVETKRECVPLFPNISMFRPMLLPQTKKQIASTDRLREEL